MAHTYGTEEWDKAYTEYVAARLESQPQPYIYFTPEWVTLYEKAVQEDAQYKEVAKAWEGSVVLHIQAKPEYGLDKDVYLFMDLWHGDCNYMKIVPAETGQNGDFVITGTIDRWITVGKKQLDPVKGMMQGKLKLKGDLPTIVRNVRAAMRLVDLSADVGGKYPDELSPDEVASLSTMMGELSEQFGIG
jgi:putative sterol carrier protein